MAKRTFQAGVTSQTIDVFVQDASSGIGAGQAGLAFGTSGLKCYYRKGATGSATSVTLATQTVGGAWSSGGFVEIDATNMKGQYRFDVPDTVLASSPWATIYFYGAANMAPVIAELEIVSVNPFDAVRYGLTALPNAAAEAAGGLYTRGSGAGQINQDANGRVDVNAKAWLGGTIPAVNVTGVPLVDAKYLLGTVLATPATAGVIDANVKSVNNVTATSVTTVNANLGTTQPVNFTGTGASALAKSDMVDVAGAAVSTLSAQIGVNAVSTSAGAITDASFAAGTGKKVVRANTAAAGSGSTITLDAAASATDSIYNGLRVYLTGGTGIGQNRTVIGYVGSTQVATVDRAWQTNPDNTSTFALLPADGAKVDSSLQVVSASVQGNVTGTVSTLTTYTGNTPQTGDAYARIGAAGAGLTALGDTHIANLDAAVTTRMATFTLPTNFSSLVIDSTGRVNAFLIGILTSVFTEGATGRIASAFKQFFNIATPAATMDHGVLVDTVTTATTATNLTNAPTAGDFTATMKTSLNAATPAVTVSDKTGFSLASGAITAAVVADGAIDRATFAADTGLLAIRSNTAQAGSGTSVTLDASASSVTDFYKNDLVAIVSGTGAGQARFITAYNGSTKVATVAAWATNPDNTSVFVITPFDSVPGATAPTAAANATAVWQDLLSGSDFTTSGSVGKLIHDDIDAAISSRSTYAGGDTSGVTTLLARLTALRAGYLDNLSAGAVALESSLQGLITTVGVAGAGLTAADDAVIAAIGALNNLSQANVRTALGLGSANLDTQLSTIAGYIDTEVAAIKAKTDNLPSDPADASDIAASFSSIASTLATVASYIDTEVAAIKAKTDNLPAAPAAVGDIPTAAQNRAEMDSNSTKLTSIAALFTTAMTESYNADGAAPTPAQALFFIMQRLSEFSISGTTLTARKLDGSTTAFTLTFDDATAPTSSTRAT